MLRSYIHRRLSFILREQFNIWNAYSYQFQFSLPKNGIRLLSDRNVGKTSQERAIKNDANTKRKSSRNGRSNSHKYYLKEMEKELNNIRRDLSNTPHLPDLFASSPLQHIQQQDRPTDGTSHDDIVQRGRIFLKKLKLLVEERCLDQSFAREVSLMLQQSLWLFRTSFSDCKRVLALSEEWNLDINHLTPVLEAGCREEKWKETAEIFLKSIDPDEFGFAPMLIEVKRPIGLFVIAKDAQLRGLPVAETVMEAVISMSMVNPTDQQKCKFIVLFLLS